MEKIGNFINLVLGFFLIGGFVIRFLILNDVINL